MGKRTKTLFLFCGFEKDQFIRECKTIHTGKEKRFIQQKNKVQEILKIRKDKVFTVWMFKEIMIFST